MEDSRGNSIREAIEKYGPITDRFILRLGKSEEEAGKFESWHSNPSTFEEDFQGYLACLNLTRLVDSVEERMKAQKGSIRAIKKVQRETAKVLAKEQEKLQKAIDKAAAKVLKEAEKIRIKAEAKAERERLKAEKKAGITCTSISTMVEEVLQSDTTPLVTLVAIPVTPSLPSPSTPAQETPQPVVTNSTAEPEAGLSSMFESKYVPTFKLPMEG